MYKKQEGYTVDNVLLFRLYKCCWWRTGMSINYVSPIISVELFDCVDITGRWLFFIFGIENF